MHLGHPPVIAGQKTQKHLAKDATCFRINPTNNPEINGNNGPLENRQTSFRDADRRGKIHPETPC